jgi:hypothetical protein
MSIDQRAIGFSAAIQLSCQKGVTPGQGRLRMSDAMAKKTRAAITAAASIGGGVIDSFPESCARPSRIPSAC